MYAYRVGTERYSIHNWEDDGEWGGARWIMEAISSKNVYNRLVCVTRWYGGKHMGRARFETIKEMVITPIEDHVCKYPCNKHFTRYGLIKVQV